MVIEFRQPDEHSVKELKDNMSREDRVELICQGISPEFGVDYSVQHSLEAVAIYVDGELTCITGLVIDDALGYEAYPWMLGTPALQKHPKKLMKYSNILIKRWLTKHPYLVNYVDARYTRAIRWLQHLGAKLEYLPEHGLYSRPFYKFTFGEP